MFDRLDQLEARYEDLGRQMSDPTLVQDQKKFQSIAKQHRDMEPTVEKFREYRKIKEGIAEAKAMLADPDPDVKAMAQEELSTLEPRLAPVEEELKVMLLPKDPNDEKNVILELRAGTGGDEAAIFAGDLARMYMRFAEIAGMKTELVSESPSDAGGYKEIVFAVKGDEPYRFLKHESGVHRVQRVPATEAQGRIHTSTATVAVLPQVEDDVEVAIKPSELQIDTYKASGAGGQYVNKTESAIRITHVPTGIVVASQQERSQQQNREKAMQMLRATLYDRKRREQEDAVVEMRRSQVGTGERSEKIRTYNFPQDRVTDHRINRSFGNLRGIMDGNLGSIADELIADERARLMAGEAV